jgi:hypothetical protein
MTRRLLIGVILVLISASADAAERWRQPGCEARLARPAVGGAVGTISAGNRPSRTTFNADVWDDLSTEAGVSVSLNGSIPLGSEFAMRVEVSTARVSVVRTMLDSARPHDVIGRGAAGHFDVRQYTASVVRYNDSYTAICPYAGGGIGLYQFSAGDARATSPGVFGVVGLEFSIGQARAIGVEVAIHVANNKGRDPLSEELAFIGRPAVVYRRHF